jgi:hypothetical protein
MRTRCTRPGNTNGFALSRRLQAHATLPYGSKIELIAMLTDFSPEQLRILTRPKEAIEKHLTYLCRKLSIMQGRVGMELEQNLQPASYAVTACYRSNTSRPFA